MRRLSYVDNGSDKLIIVFQSAGRVPTEKIKAYLNKNISDQDIKNFMVNIIGIPWPKGCQLQIITFWKTTTQVSMDGIFLILEKILLVLFKTRLKILYRKKNGGFYNELSHLK